MVQAADCDPTPRTPEETSELFSRLEDALIKQIEVHCSVVLPCNVVHSAHVLYCSIKFTQRKVYVCSVGEKPFMFLLFGFSYSQWKFVVYLPAQILRVVWLSFILQMCVRNGEHYQKLGDISNTKR